MLLLILKISSPGKLPRQSDIQEKFKAFSLSRLSKRDPPLVFSRKYCELIVRQKPRQNYIAEITAVSSDIYKRLRVFVLKANLSKQTINFFK